MIKWYLKNLSLYSSCPKNMTFVVKIVVIFRRHFCIIIIYKTIKPFEYEKIESVFDRFDDDGGSIFVRFRQKPSCYIRKSSLDYCTTNAGGVHHQKACEKPATAVFCGQYGRKILDKSRTGTDEHRTTAGRPEINSKLSHCCVKYSKCQISISIVQIILTHNIDY